MERRRWDLGVTPQVTGKNQDLSAFISSPWRRTGEPQGDGKQVRLGVGGGGDAFSSRTLSAIANREHQRLHSRVVPESGTARSAARRTAGTTTHAEQGRETGKEV
ncbi:hypothetical protein SKAU_G00257690 [Synaphobranchus kaupii]|uniref:Uncharacterized protein n=1 Tax=Synaphobranchus kaupii TaxID=118154 RepID=A0A9Q1F441_SYNKA|nr:hypothetical protein SKAU_G00257690 [Synaphobranchus kaupii]